MSALRGDGHDDGAFGRLDRRTFLRLSGGGMAALIGQLAHPRVLAPRARRGEAAAPVVLASADLEVLIDRARGLPLEYRLHPSNVRFHADEAEARPAVTLCNRERWQFVTVPASAGAVTAGERQAEVHFAVADAGRPAASFTLRYVVDGASMSLGMTDVREHDGYELIDVAIPRLVSLREQDGAVWLAHGDTGGNLVALADATPGRLSPNRFWGRVHATLPVVMLGTDRALCVQEVTAFMDETELRVESGAGGRRVSAGTVQRYRVNGSGCYDMNTGTGTPRSCGTARTPNLLIDQPSACRLDFIARRAGSAPPAWLDGAHLVRRRMPAPRERRYENAFMYGILCDQPAFAEPATTFAQCEELIRRVAALTDGATQIVHLWGWQYRGKDTGYPAVDQVDPRLGGYDGMRQLMERARAYHCAVTLSDNYDDAYRSSPAWDPAFVARRPDGELWESRNWTGESSYILGVAKYMRGPGAERVRYTCERYALPGTTHIDVLSYYSVRDDWDPARPASGVVNLRDGRYRVLEEFAKHGVDVTSEALRYAFIGRISAFWNLTGVSPCPFGGQPIPMIPAVYGGSAVWGNAGRATTLAGRLLDVFFYSAPAHTFFRHDTDPRSISDIYYLMWLPWRRLHARSVVSFRRDGARTITGLEGNGLIDIDWSTQRYRAQADGVEIARDGATCCPVGDDRLAFYATTARELEYPLPAGWRASNVAAQTLTGDEPTEAPFSVTGGLVTVAVPERQPVIVRQRR